MEERNLDRTGGRVKVYGRLDAFYETGTEGVYWSLHDHSLPSYDGLWILRNGDHLEVLDTDWKGVIEYDYDRDKVTSQFGYTGQAVRGFWVHGVQVGMDSEAWADMFFSSQRAILTLGEEQEAARVEHPFHGPLEGLEQRLRALPPKRLEELFRSSLYPWLVFYSGGEWFSLAKKWGFCFEETIKLIGSPTEKQVETWKQYPKQANDMLMPFSWPQFLRLALLFHINGAFEWQFRTMDDAKTWATDRRELFLRPGLGGLYAVIEALDAMDTRRYISV